MLRIAKTSPGILDLSAVKDEFGLPVTLNGPSHRDIPDHEENNPILQRVVELQWVTITRILVDVPVEDSSIPSESDLLPPETLEGPPEAPETLEGPPEAPETLEGPPIEDNNPLSATSHVDDVNASPSSDENVAVDVSAKHEVPSKPFNRSETRRAGRRS